MEVQSSEQIRDLRQHLQSVFESKQQKNGQYSLRAFARSLGVPHSTLSLYFRGLRDLSSSSIQKIYRKLELQPGQFFRGPQRGPQSTHDLMENRFCTLKLDQYELISDWAHYAILSLTKIVSFEMTADNIAARLGIERAHAQECFERLQRMELLKKSRNGKWIQGTAPLKVDNKISTLATRKSQRKIVEKALESMEKDAFEKRDINAVMFAMDKNLLELAAEKIRKFRRKLMTELESAGSANEVYIFSMQLFPVTKGNSDS